MAAKRRKTVWCRSGAKLHKKNGTMHRPDQHHVCIRKRNHTRLGERQHPQSHAGPRCCPFRMTAVSCCAASVRKASMTCDSDLESLSSWTGSPRVTSSSFLWQNPPPVLTPPDNHWMCFAWSETVNVSLSPHLKSEHLRTLLEENGGPA